jgi:aromatic ring-opening dioxygenase catalytic subunit (LigB family)
MPHLTDTTTKYKVSVNLKTGQRVVNLLRAAGINAYADPTFGLCHYTFLAVLRMFPEQNTSIHLLTVPGHVKNRQIFPGRCLLDLRLPSATLYSST